MGKNKKEHEVFDQMKKQGFFQKDQQKNNTVFNKQNNKSMNNKMNSMKRGQNR